MQKAVRYCIDRPRHLVDVSACKDSFAEVAKNVAEVPIEKLEQIAGGVTFKHGDLVDFDSTDWEHVYFVNDLGNGKRVLLANEGDDDMGVETCLVPIEITKKLEDALDYYSEIRSDCGYCDFGFRYIELSKDDALLKRLFKQQSSPILEHGKFTVYIDYGEYEMPRPDDPVDEDDDEWEYEDVEDSSRLIIEYNGKKGWFSFAVTVNKLERYFAVDKATMTSVPQHVLPLMAQPNRVQNVACKTVFKTMGWIMQTTVA